LIYAFAGRAAWFIADDERATQWAFPDILTEQTEIRVDGALFRLAFSEACPAEALASLVGTGDFHWDAVWVAALSREDALRLEGLIRASAINAFEGVPRTDVEMMMPIGDGHGLWWINPRNDRRDVVAKLSDVTRSVGWSLDLERLSDPVIGE